MFQTPNKPPSSQPSTEELRKKFIQYLKSYYGEGEAPAFPLPDTMTGLQVNDYAEEQEAGAGLNMLSSLAGGLDSMIAGPGMGMGLSDSESLNPDAQSLALQKQIAQSVHEQEADRNSFFGG